MKKLIFVFLVFSFIAGIPSFMKGNQVVTPEELIKRMTNAYTALANYELTQIDKGYDTYVKDRRRSVSKQYGKDLKRLGEETEVIQALPKRMEATFVIRHMRPYAISMKILKANFLPSILNKTRVFYQSDKVPKHWRVVPGFFPLFTVRRSISKHDPAGLFTMGWILPFLILDIYQSLSDMEMKPGQTFDGQDCSILELRPRLEKNKTLEFGLQDLEKWNFPVPILEYVLKDLEPIKKERPETLKFWIDTQSYLILKVERFVDGKLFWTTEYRNIRLNHLDRKDF